MATNFLSIAHCNKTQLQFAQILGYLTLLVQFTFKDKPEEQKHKKSSWGGHQKFRQKLTVLLSHGKPVTLEGNPCLGLANNVKQNTFTSISLICM